MCIERKIALAMIIAAFVLPHSLLLITCSKVIVVCVMVVALMLLHLGAQKFFVKEKKKRKCNTAF